MFLLLVYFTTIFILIFIYLYLNTFVSLNSTQQNKLIYLSMTSTTSLEKYHFVYNGVEYDATDYAEKHPGGLQFLKNMREVNKDFTQYFRALHSNEAEKILKSFPIISIKEPSKTSQEYNQIFKKVEVYFAPNWTYELLLLGLVASTFLVGCISGIAFISILGFAFSQVVVGWNGHSAAHNRNKNLMSFGRYTAALVGGFSLEWWSPKHNMHHMFTNLTKFDEDIQHSYKVYLYPFLYLKWRFDSLVCAVTTKNYLDVTCILTNYIVLLYFRECLLYFLIGQLMAGFYSAYVLIGNHEREVRFEYQPNMPFVDHQIQTCRNYKETSIFWLILMGGMQYQSEHHLFPQIPYYNLPKAKEIIITELGRLNKTLIYGPVL